ncbi:hypothetical protein RUM44_004709, partial [Polyplax serrata]
SETRLRWYQPHGGTRYKPKSRIPRYALTLWLIPDTFDTFFFCPVGNAGEIREDVP